MNVKRCTFIVENARIVDGTGGPSTTGSVAVDGDRITAVGDCTEWQADEVFDADGHVLAPGFIDCHTHDDSAVLAAPDMAMKVSQGVTTVVAGNCGISLAPFETGHGLPPPFPLLGREENFTFPTVTAYRNKLERTPPALNLALLTGHSALRVNVRKDDLDRAATEDELAAMQERLRCALREGSIGLSTGLGYPPAREAPPEEITALACVLREFGRAVYATHMRDEGDHVLEAVEETIATGRAAGVQTVISHHKCAGPKNYGRSTETLAAIAAARAEQPLGLDVYPYTASSTSLLPDFIRESEDVLITYSDPHPDMAGRRLADVAEEWECDPLDAARRLYPAGAIYFQMDEEDLRRILSSPGAMIGSDGLPGSAKPHPRLWGTFPRVLDRYVRQQKLLELEDAVHRMTGLTAKTFGFEDRGIIAPGAYADLVLFDPDTVTDTATFEEPEQPSLGISKVFVNGHAVWSDRRSTGERSGRFLSH